LEFIQKVKSGIGIMVAKNIDISIILPVYNHAKFLRNCLESIFNTDYQNFEVIVVDDGSRDGYVDIVLDFPCQVIKLKENRGPAVARNAGIKRAKGSLFLFTDADCIVQKDWVKAIYAEYRRLNEETGNIGAMGGRIIPNERFVSKCIAYSGYYAFQHGDKITERPDLCAANLLVVKEAFNGAGGFNENLTNGEDTDLTCRIYEKDYKVIYNPKTYVLHDHRKTMFEFFIHQKVWGEVHGLQLEIKYQKIRKLKPFLLNTNPYIYLLFLSIPVSLGITYRSIKINFKYDKMIIIYSFFVFISKLFYRWGVVKWLFRNRNKIKEA
jgi:glycosyltransferase involved in cell wall biosynthesis